MMASRSDPAERSGYLRFLYRDWRPTRLGRIHNRVCAWVSGLGLTPQISYRAANHAVRGGAWAEDPAAQSAPSVGPIEAGAWKPREH